MFDGLTLAKEKITLCTHNSINEKGQKLDYYLYSVITSSGSEYYALEIRDKDSSAFEIIGDELCEAKELYSRIVKGRVGCICLCDIVCDVKMSKKY